MVTCFIKVSEISSNLAIVLDASEPEATSTNFFFLVFFAYRLLYSNTFQIPELLHL